MAAFAGDTTKVVADGGPGTWSTAPWSSNPYGSALYYYDLNFDDAFSACVTLFMLMIQNNWPVISAGLEVVRDTKWVRVYFVLFNCFIEVVLLNIFIGVLINVLSEIREQEIAAEAAGSQDTFKAEVQGRMDRAKAPSGAPYSDLWEVHASSDMNTEEFKVDERMVLNKGVADNATMQSVLSKISVPMVGRTKEGFICWGNKAFVSFCGEDEQMGMTPLIDDKITDYVGDAIALSMRQWQGTEGSEIWHDVQDDARCRKPSGKTFRISRQPCDFNVAAASELTLQAGSDLAGRGMLYCFFEDIHTSSTPSTPSPEEKPAIPTESPEGASTFLVVPTESPERKLVV